MNTNKTTHPTQNRTTHPRQNRTTHANKTNKMEPSLCIPRVHANISENRIQQIFNDLKLGIIERIDIVSCKKNDNFKTVFIHFRKWFEEGNARIAREKLKLGEEIKIIYDDPWFWKISAYRENHNTNNTNDTNKNRIKKVPIIQFEEEKEEIDIFGREKPSNPNPSPTPNQVKKVFTHEPRTPSCSPPPPRRRSEEKIYNHHSSHKVDTYDKGTYDKGTYDKDTYDKDIYDKDTYDKDTYDKDTYDKDIYDKYDMNVEDIYFDNITYPVDYGEMTIDYGELIVPMKNK